MKKFKRILLTMGLTVLSALSLAGLSACKEDEKIEYSFNTNGGTAIENVEVGKGDTYTLPVPEREGYAFEGWYTSENFSGEPVTSVVAEGNVTYYAKWTKLCVITLELDGGSLSETALYLKAGENVYNFMQNYVPTKTGLTFGGWFDGTAELTQSKKMPEAGLTLTAKYKVGYTIEIWLQNIALDGYERAEDVVGYGYVGTAFTSEQKLTGFKEVILSGGSAPTVSEKSALSENAEENVFRHYFDRESYTVRFNSNYPGDGDTGAAETVSVLYGTEVQVPSDYAYEGYCLLGWATSASGEATYKAYYVDTVLYNNDGEVRSADTFIPERNTTLYAVWAKGYTDMFGGNDYIYLLGEENVAYLARGNVFFKGEYNAKYNDFIFEDENGKIKAEGRIYENGTFSYINETRTNTLHIQGEGLVKNTKIIFDEYNGLTYSVQDEDGKISHSTGTFTRDFENNCYVATFTEGELAGQKLTFMTSTVELDDVKWPVFRIRNEEEVNMGQLVRFAVRDGSVVYYYVYDITLDGFGVASYNNGTTTETYYYTLEDGLLTLTTSSGTVFGTARVVDVNGRKGYMLYTEWLDREFTLDSGDTLKLDGGGEAVYTVGDKEKIGYYTTADSNLGNTIVTVYVGNEEYIFLVTSHKEDVPVIDGSGEKTEETEQVTTYTIEAKPAGYAEYRYVADGLVYRSPMLVLNDTETGKATLYGHKDESGEYVKIAVGSYVENNDGYYIYTVTERFDGSELVTEPFDLSLLKSFVFCVNSDATNYSVTYWRSSTMEDGTTTEYVKNYTSANGEKLQLVGGFAFLTGEKLSFVGAHSTKDGITTLINGSSYYYVELYEDGTFVLLQYSPYTARVLNEDNTVKTNETVVFDGKGNATYVITTSSENEEEAKKTEYVGTVKNLNKKTDEGAEIFLFESSELKFEYIIITSGNYSYIARYSDTYNGTYESGFGMLSLDGFGYMATYINAQGDVYTGRYKVSAKNFIVLYIEEPEKYFYFDVKGNAFTVRSQEYGTYLLVDNQYQEYYIELDGYDKASIYELTLPEGAEEYVREYLDENGTYTVNGDVFTVVYKVGNETFTIYGKLDSINANGNEYATFSIIHEEVVRVYVSEKDWSVLILDDIGNAVKYDQEGFREEGSYTLVTDKFLYYVNDALTDACIYEYDIEKGTATPVKFTARGYYTEALESLLFSEYGYAYFGSTRYYYNVENGNVLLYRYAKEGEAANAYGFVEDDTFGSFTNVKTHEGKTYYANDGFAIGFSRDAATKNKYPVQVSNSDQNKYALEGLSFQPGTGDQFTVVATVLLNGKNYDCYVVRTLNEANEAEMYISLGYYRFYINVSYKGTNSDGSSNNTYEVVKLHYVRPLYSYTYLNAYYFNAIFFGSALENNYGMITIRGEYDEVGEMTKYYVEGQFKKASGLTDADGNIIGFEEAAYGYSNGVYMARFTAEDGYTYSLYFGLRYHSAFGMYGYSVVALARQQTLETENGYAVQVERVVATEMTSISVGQVYTVTLKSGEEMLAADTILLINGTIYYVVRTKTEDGKITETKYYKVKLVEEEDSSIESGTTKNVPFYKSATVEAEDVTTVYTQDGKLYVDISAERGVTLIALYNETLVAVESSYDESTSTYTVKSSDNRVFAVRLVNGAVEIDEVMSTEGV